VTKAPIPYASVPRSVASIGPFRSALHRFRVLMNPLLWLMGGADPQHRAEFMTAVELATRELDERPVGDGEGGPRVGGRTKRSPGGGQKD
jgi:hypothetical protein